MNIVIDYNSKIPVYEQVVNEVEKLVILNILKPNEQIPSIRDLAIELSINPNTVKKAYDVLENKGIIVSRSTKGSFISENSNKAKRDKIDKLLNDIETITNELVNYGVTTEEIIKKITTKKPHN